MPKVRRADLPRALLNHLFDRIRERSTGAEQLGLLAEWPEARQKFLTDDGSSDSRG